MRKITWVCLFTTFILFLSIHSIYAQTVWTYDFENATGSHTSDESTSFLPTPQTDGGSSRVRIGSGGGKIELLNPGSTDLGTYSQLTLTASASSSDNLFQVYSFNGSNSFYISFKMKFVGGNSGIIGFLYGNGTDFGDNTGYIGNSFSGFRSTFESDGSLTTERRTSSGWSDAFSIDAVFNKSTIYTVEIYANNSSGTLTYFRNGGEQTLSSQEWSLWIDGTQFDDFSSIGLSVDQIIDGFLFYGQNSTSNVAKIEIDDIVYSNSLPDLRTISGDNGWRMLTSPMDGFDVDQLARQNLVQGVTGSYSSSTPNIYTSHSGSSSDNDWNSPSGLSSSLDRGQGFIWYLYDNAQVLESKPLPLDLVIAKNQTSGDTIVDLTTANNGWSLIGNPFSEDLLVDNVSNWNLPNGGSLQSSTVQVYDPSADSYVILGSSGEKVGAMQGFFLQTNDADQIEIPTSAKSSGATFYKRANNQAIVKFELSGRDTKTGEIFKDRALRLYFHEDANQDWDLYDAQKLTSLEAKHIGMGFVGTNMNDEIVLKAQDSRPIHFDKLISIPVDFFATGIKGEAELSILHSSNIPNGLLIEIEDTETGTRQLLNSQTPFRFDFTSSKAKKSNVNDDIKIANAPIPQTAKTTGYPRFYMHIHPNQKKYEYSQLPQRFVLNQNYPNPFNPMTSINYSLPQPSDVQLAVYDMLGREISILVNGRVNAGNHTVTFDASSLSSGIYLYRLTANQHVYTKKLTVVK